MGKHLLAVIRVRKAHVFKAYISPLDVQRFGTRLVKNIHTGVHYLEKAFHSSHALLELLGKLHQPADRGDQCADIHHVSYQVSGLDFAIDHEQGACHQHHQIHQTVKQTVGGLKTTHIEVAVPLDIVEDLVALFKLLLLQLFVGKGFHNAHAQKAILHLGVNLSQLDALATELLFHFMVEICGCNDNQRHHGKHDQRQPYIDAAEDHERTNDLDSRDEKFLGAVMGKLRHIEQIGGDTGHDLPDLRIVKIVERQLLQMIEHGGTHIGFDFRAHNMADRGHKEIRGSVYHTQE